MNFVPIVMIIHFLVLILSRHYMIHTVSGRIWDPYRMFRSTGRCMTDETVGGFKLRVDVVVDRFVQWYDCKGNVPWRSQSVVPISQQCHCDSYCYILHQQFSK